MGTKQTVGKLYRDKVSDFFRKFYTPDDLIISAAGNLEHEAVADLIADKFGEHQNLTQRSRGSSSSHTQPDYDPQQKGIGAGAHLPGSSFPSLSHEDRYVCYILNTILGGGMSSRLFQNIREKQGLVYTIFSGLNSYRDTGCLSIYAGTSLETAENAWLTW